MLPYKTEDGREALLERPRLRGQPYERDGTPRPSFSTAPLPDRLSNIKFTTLGDISESLGANVTW